MLETVAHRLEPAVHSLFVTNSLVRPVRRGAVLRLVIHPARTYLDFDISPVPVLDGYVQGLVAVRPRSCKPVSQTLGIGLIFLSHKRIHLPAKVLLDQGVVFAINDEAYGKHVIDLLERHFLHLHLAVN